MKKSGIFYAVFLGLPACTVLPDGAVAAHDAPTLGASSGTSTRSIHEWVSCTGTSDDTAGVAKAFAAAAHGRFTLDINCPVNLKIGMDIARSIFIEDGTRVDFSGAGKITVDNVFIPAFVIADSDHIELSHWNVEYDASLPITQNIGGHVNNGMRVTGAKPANAFNDSRLTGWLAANRGITFDRRQGAVYSQWTGTTNACAVFFITGDSSDLKVTGMHLYAPPGAGGERFIPVAFSFSMNFRRNQTVVSKTPLTPQSFAVPHDIHFTDIDLDGTYMGWVGTLQEARFDGIRSERYADLQEADGSNVGGIQKWFAPPHLFYFSYTNEADAALYNRDIQIENVVDSGIRIGRARDAGGTDTLSGYALSIKIGCFGCRVAHYRSNRPDGFLDVLNSDGLTIADVSATFDSGFLNNLFPGWRFPSNSYKNVTFENITLIDTAASSVQGPIGNSNQPANQNIVMKNVRVEMNHWAGDGRLPFSTITGQGNDLSLDYTIKDTATRLVRAQKDPLQITLQAVPATLRTGVNTAVGWSTRNADRCTASGAWTGSVGTSGARTLSFTAAGTPTLMLTCSNGSQSATASLRFDVSR